MQKKLEASHSEADDLKNKLETLSLQKQSLLEEIKKDKSAINVLEKTVEKHIRKLVDWEVDMEEERQVARGYQRQIKSEQESKKML